MKKKINIYLRQNKMYKVNIVICWLKGIFRSLFSVVLFGFPFSGHDFEVIEEHKNCVVTISKCEFCNKVDILWEKNIK